MKLHNIPLDQIEPNPWRDLKLYPLDAEHIADLRASINDHGFFTSVKGRRRGGKVEIACGHARLAAARKAKLETLPVFIDDMDDDAMLRLMTDENATQSGSNPGAIMNEVAAVTRRLIEGILTSGTIVPDVARAFESKLAIDSARGKVRNGNAHMALGQGVIRAYLGDGNSSSARRGERQVREAISALKESGRYDDIIDEVLRKYPPAVTDKAPAKRSEVATTKQPKSRRRLLDERTASVFPNDHQFHAFREAVTTRAAQQVIPVDQQLALAKDIMDPRHREDFKRKQIGAPYIKMRVQTVVQDGMKKQRSLDKEERTALMVEEREAEIDAELHSASASLRSLNSAIVKLISLAGKYPHHPKIGGFSAKLDLLVSAIQQLSKKLK